eukprot:TRINITY_DN1326_c0_g1_i2.p1 TRINITY_DN1326_c0_g1~~TRINITY_DN1326_c0_g1_i2.p1  ORF type:complete len:174 (+),score=16.22 TRINITY_DN1326_c0_g1_i2:115-636(+)
MGLGALRSILRPFAKRVLTTPVVLVISPVHEYRPVFDFTRNAPYRFLVPGFHSLTDTRYPKRRPSATPRRKRASLKPPGPYAWVQYVPGEPIPRSRPNEGSVKGRNQKKRMRQRRAFILSEAKKRKAQLQEAKRKKNMKKIERKMAAVARERAWAQRLAELQQLEHKAKETVA